MRRYFEGVAVADAEMMVEPWVDDLVYQERFSVPPRRIEGKEALRSYFSKAGTVYRMSMEINEVHECTDPDKLILEYTSHGEVVTSGDVYENSYIGVYRFREGRIWTVSEFHNALITERLRPAGVVIERLKES